MPKVVKKFYPRYLSHLHQAVAKQHLGSGGFADVSVYQCQEIHNHDHNDSNGNSNINSNTKQVCNQSFVVKQLRFADVGCWNREDMQEKYRFFQESLLHEYEIGRQICHPNVIRTLDVDSETNSLILENVIGIDMLDYLDKNGSQKAGVHLLKCFEKALCGLQHMHDLGIAHMDIKLENILLDTKNDQVKLIDLGQAQVFLKEGDYQTSSRVCGTEGYFPPEFYNRLNFYPDKVDIWCCGIVLYNLIFDRMPWGLSCHKDPLYARCEEYLKTNKLHPKCFNKSSYQIPELTEKDAEILEDIFISVFNLSPKLRPDVCELRSRLQQLSVFNEHHSQVEFS
ncbi:MAG: hypothetical protein EBU90_08845 [Proteobacteria bacterium]|nr:hypothetical protein [Pseudomonadota bacterium]NBP13606.1 hypothetical protein [bacterium]